MGCEYSICRIKNCKYPVQSRSMCKRHYIRWWRYGDPLAGRSFIDDPLSARFWRYTKKSQGCWEWIGPKITGGYGQLRFKGENVYAHRLAYELLVGPIPTGLTIDHLCRNRACVNPAHLEPVTNKENILRGITPAAQNARKTHCKHGHPFNKSNTGRSANGRYCRACMKIRNDARYH